MKTNLFWLVALGLPLLLLGGAPSRGWAAEAESKAQPPAKAEKAEPKAETGEQKEEAAGKAPEAKATPTTETAAKKPAGLVGTIIAFTPESRTLVVDAPRGNQVLRIGAVVTERTTIRQGSRKAALASLKEGERVRLTFHRIASGDEATSVDILRAAKG